MAKSKTLIRKPSKKRSKKYEPKLQVNGSFDDVLNVMLKPKNKKINEN